jgi:hypothetical protein
MASTWAIIDGASMPRAMISLGIGAVMNRSSSRRKSRMVAISLSGSERARLA